MTKKKLVSKKNVWLAHTKMDPISSFCHSVEQTFIEEYNVYLGDIIHILNEDIIFKRDPNDDFDEISTGIQSCDFVIALYSAKTNEEDLVAQLRRASLYKKAIVILFYPLPDYGELIIPKSNDLRQMFSGLPHLYAYSKNIPYKLIEFAQNVQLHNESSKQFDVFISHKSEDFLMSKEIYNSLSLLNKKVFLSEISIQDNGSSDFMKTIDNALDNAKHLIVVCSSVENVMSGWVEAEWRVFINEKRSERKDGNIITIITKKMKPSDLPLALRYYNVLVDGDSSIIDFL